MRTQRQRLNVLADAAASRAPSPAEWLAAHATPEALVDERRAQLAAIRRYRLALGVSLCLSLGIAGGTGYVAWIALRPPQVAAYVSDGELFTRVVTPVVHRLVTTDMARQWTKTAVAELMSLHFRTAREDLATRERLFGRDGFQQYVDTLAAGNVIERVAREGLVITAVNATEPEMVRGVLVDGQPRWVFRFAVVQSIQGAASETMTRRRTVTVEVHGVDRKRARSGLQIVDFRLGR